VLSALSARLPLLFICGVPAAFSLPTSRRAPMTLKAVLVGCGAMSQTWLDAVAQIDGLGIVGLVDLDASRAEAVALRHGLGGVTVGSNLAELLDRTRPDIVFDLVVPAARHAVVSTALAAGCHVLSEKPMAETLEQARDLIAQAAAADRLHAVVQNRRYLPNVRRIAAAVASGAIGELTSVHADFFLAPHFGGFREEMAHVLLMDMAIHAFDALRCMTGQPARNVYCREWDPRNSWYQQGSSAMAIFELGNGALFTYRGSWCAAGMGTSWECAWRLVGTRGTLVWDGHDQLVAEISTGERNGLFDQVAPVALDKIEAAGRIGGHLGVLQDFVAAVRGGPPPETRGTDNIQSLAMTLGAIASARAGKQIDIVI
jgi:predicted dehydrogenase